MAKPGFDISTLLDFQPPRYVCEGCGAIYPDEDCFEWAYADADRANLVSISCLICQNTYPARMRDYWDHHTRVRFENVLVHSQALATVASYYNTEAASYTASEVLFKALSSAQLFVHFSSYGIDPFFLGVFKMLAQRVTVRGIVSNLEPGYLVADEINSYSTETPDLLINTFGKNANAPHVKLVVIDGLMAIKGSVNMTHRGMRTKTEMNRELFEVVTAVDMVRDLNNRYFSGTWRLSNCPNNGLPF